MSSEANKGKEKKITSELAFLKQKVHYLRGGHVHIMARGWKLE